MPETSANAESAILVWASDSPTSLRLEKYLSERNFSVTAADNVGSVLRALREQVIEIVILHFETLSPVALDLCRTVKEGTVAPYLIAIVDPKSEPQLRSSLPTICRPDTILVTPVPWAKLLNLLEERLWSGSIARSISMPVRKPVIDLVLELWHQKATGRLELVCEGVQTHIYFSQGIPVFAEHGSLGDSLGRMLVEMKKITPQDLSRAIDYMTNRLVDDEQLRLGEVLIEMGILSAADVFEALRQQVQSKILGCLGWIQYVHTFVPDEALVNQVGRFECAVERLVLKAVKEHFSPAQLEQRLEPNLLKYPVLTSSLEETERRFGLRGKEPAFIAQITGRRTLKLLRDASQLDMIHAGQLLVVLLLTKCIELKEASPERKDATLPAVKSEKDTGPKSSAAPPTSVQSQNIMGLYVKMKGKADHELLNVSVGASPQDIQKAFDKQTKELKVVDAAIAAEPDLRGKVRELMTHLLSARDRMLKGQQLSGEYATISHDQKKRQLAAEKMFQQGKTALWQRRFSDAQGSFFDCVRLQPAAEHDMYHSWVCYLTATETKAKARHAEQTRQAARQVFGARTNDAMAHLILSHFLCKERKFERAQRHLELAEKFAPDLPFIKEERKILEQERSSRAKLIKKEKPAEGSIDNSDED